MAIRIEKEVENEIVREVARRIFNSVPKNDDSFKVLEFFARRHISRKTMKGLVNEYLKL